MKKYLLAISTLGLLGLTACGGGGGGGSSTTPIVTSQAVLSGFPLQSAFKAFVSKRSETDYKITGSCLGTTKIILTAPSAATFDGAPALSVDNIISGTFSNSTCTPASFSSTSITYYDSNYVPLGGSSSSQYGIFLTAPPRFPISVKLGDTAFYGTQNLFTDSSQKTPLGRSDFSYVIELDGTSTNSAIANLITKDYNQSNELLKIDQARYRLGVDGTFTPLSKDTQLIITARSIVLTAI